MKLILIPGHLFSLGVWYKAVIRESFDPPEYIFICMETMLEELLILSSDRTYHKQRDKFQDLNYNVEFYEHLKNTQRKL